MPGRVCVDDDRAAAELHKRDVDPVAFDAVGVSGGLLGIELEP